MMQRHRPLLLTADTNLLDDLLEMAAAVGVAVDVAVEPATCRARWRTAPLVVVGSDLAPALNPAELEARPGVLLVASGSPDAGLHEIGVRIGVEQCIGLPADEATVLDRLADTAEPSVRGRVIGVLPGRGGAGASVLAAALAVTAAAHGGPAWLVDLDPLGGGADVGMGAELTGGARWPDLGVLTGRLSHAALRAAVPEVLGTAVIAADPRAGEPAAEAVRAVLAAARRGGGTVVLDLARHRSACRDEAISVTDDLVVVVPAEVRAVLAARAVIEGLGPVRAVVRVAVRTVPAGLPAPEVARALGLRSVGVLTDDPSVRDAILTGETAGLLRGGSLAAVCASLLDSPTPARAAA